MGGDNSYSHYIRKRACCERKVIQTNTIVETIIPYKMGILYYSDIQLNDAGEAFAEYDYNTTLHNGEINFINGNNGDSLVTFSNENILSNSNIEIYAHCDAETNSAGNDNWIIFELVGNNVESNTLSIVDIDTRSVQKGTKLHLSFGPSAYCVKENQSIQNNLTIGKNNTYRLKVRTGKAYNITEIKLIVKFK